MVGQRTVEAEVRRALAGGIGFTQHADGQLRLAGTGSGLHTDQTGRYLHARHPGRKARRDARGLALQAATHRRDIRFDAESAGQERADPRVRVIVGRAGAKDEAATHRGEDIYKHLVWALADKDVVDVRIDQWLSSYRELMQRLPTKHADADDAKLRTAISRLSQQPYGAIVKNMPNRYGSEEKVYRYKRFTETLMRGHVRLRAENEKVTLAASSKGL